MSAILHLHAAIRALLPSGITHYPGQAPKDAAAPWLVTGFTTPGPAVSEAALGVAHTGEVVVTVTTLTEDATNHWAATIDAALLGARVTAAGWTVGALTPGYHTSPYPAGVDALDTNLAYQVARLRYRFTYSPLED